jgi:predicted nuclease of predicted toxin-antitoxin system
MQFLVDANMPRSTAAAIRRLGHGASDVRDLGMGDAEDAQIARYAREHGLAVVTRDFEFSDIRNYPPSNYHGIVVLELPDDAVASQVVALLESFLRREDWLTGLATRLAVVNSVRVRFRPPLP